MGTWIVLQGKLFLFGSNLVGVTYLQLLLTFRLNNFTKIIAHYNNFTLCSHLKTISGKH
jgi:hypothetical protein